MAEEIKHGEMFLEVMNNEVAKEGVSVSPERKSSKTTSKPFQRKPGRIEDGVRLKGKKK